MGLRQGGGRAAAGTARKSRERRKYNGRNRSSNPGLASRERHRSTCVKMTCP
jgi:hypothetical protein